MSEIEITHAQGIITVADREFDLNKIDQELQGKDEFMANQEEILKDVQVEYERRRNVALEDRVLVAELAKLFNVDRSSFFRVIKKQEIPIYSVRASSEGGMQVQSAVDRDGALRLAEYYGGGDITDDSTSGQSEDTPSD